jgi:hypothetical protein
VGIGEAYNTAVAALFPEVRRIPHGWGVEAEQFVAVVTATSDGGRAGSSAGSGMARRLARDVGWQDAVAYVNYLSSDFECSLSAALAVDLHELEAQWALEQAGADFASAPAVAARAAGHRIGGRESKGEEGEGH